MKLLFPVLNSAYTRNLKNIKTVTGGQLWAKSRCHHTDMATGCSAVITSYGQSTHGGANVQVLELAPLPLDASKWSASSSGRCISGTHGHMCMVPE
jgi:hypothetical protein